MDPTRDSGALAAQVRALTVPPGHLAVWALGQQGYLLRGGGHVVIIDPYLSNSVAESSDDPYGGTARQVPIVVDPAALDMVTVACVTHEHMDHCDVQTLGPLLQAAPQCRVVASYAARDTLTAAGVDPARITVPPLDTPVDYGDGLAITAIPSAHYDFAPDAAGNPAFLGFILRLNGVTLYHSGDSIVYAGLIERLRQQPLDLACLPINGRDWFREQQTLVGNMDYREAAELAAAAAVRVLVPGHNDMFAGNRINPAYALDYLATHHPRQRVHFLQAGELYYYAG